MGAANPPPGVLELGNSRLLGSVEWNADLDLLCLLLLDH